MKVKVLRKALYLVAFLAVVASFTSCNKGYGCPNNFKVEQVVVKAAQTAVQAVVNQ